MSNTTRWYGKEEWLQLRCDNQEHILKYPSREQAVNESSGKKMKTTNTTNAVTTNEVNP